MRTNLISSSQTNHPGYGTGSGDTELYDYECPCGKGYIREEHDNNLGKVNYNGAWIEDAPTSFSKTGKYRINYQRKDNPFHTDVSLSSVFDMYRKWSTNYNDN